MGVGPQDGIGEWIGGGQGELPSLPCLSSEDGVENGHLQTGKQVLTRY